MNEFPPETLRAPEDEAMTSYLNPRRSDLGIATAPTAATMKQHKIPITLN
jgi:hypothetical protein